MLPRQLIPLLIVTCAGFSGAAQAAPPSLTFPVTFSETVTVTGCPANCPRIALTVGTATRYAVYAGGSGTNVLNFTYAADIGDVDMDGISIPSAQIDLNNGTIKDMVGNDLAPLTFTAPDMTGLA